jgi:hypothetical protein
MDIFTTNPSQSDVHMIRMHEMGWSKLFELRKLVSNYDEIIAFRPSAWCWNEMDVPTLAETKTPTSCSLDDHFDISNPLPKIEKRKADSEGYTTVDIIYSRRANITVVSVPYSEHSSFSELKDCVQLLDTKQIVPTVFKDQNHMKRILYHLSDAFPHTPMKIKLSAPIQLVNGSLSQVSKTSSFKASKSVKAEPPKNNSSILDFFKSATKKVVSTLTSGSSFTPNNKKPLILKPRTLTPKQEEKSVETIDVDDDDVVIIEDNSSSTPMSQAPIDVEFTDPNASFDLSQIDLLEQRHLLASFEKSKQPVDTSKDSASSGKKKLILKRKNTSTSTQPNKKQKTS